MFTYRGVPSSQIKPSVSPVDSAFAAKSTLHHFTIEIAPNDAREALRVVGFVEYGEALKRFDQLIPQATPEELEVFDQLVKERDEFAIHTNLTRSLPLVESSLNDPPPRLGENYERRGLAWMTALARVELGSILAAYTKTPRPFESVLRGSFDLKEMTSLLEDGMRVHFRALSNDPRLPRVMERFLPNQMSLAYLRRLVLAQAFVDAAYRFRLATYSPQQMNELQSWKAQLNTIQRRLLGNVEVFLVQRQAHQEKMQWLSQCRNACDRLIHRAFNSDNEDERERER